MTDDPQRDDMAELQLTESCPWLSDGNPTSAALPLDDLISWIVVGERTISIEGSISFCKPEILTDLLDATKCLEPFCETRKVKARARSNPFEKIGRAFFINRSALKFANLDAIIRFTNPLDAKGTSLVGTDELLYYADLCGVPGGFVDYMQWRKGWHAKGLGIASRNGYIFRFFGSDAISFEIHNGANRNGNIMEPENIDSFGNLVHQHVQTGVHLVIGDGTILNDRPNGIKELFTKQFHLSNCVLALSLLRVRGTFISKIFDSFTPFTVGLIYLMYKCFDEIAIIKLNSSRPANSERYLVCRRMKPQTDTIRDHLYQINKAMANLSDTSSDVIELVALNVLTADRKFYDYIFERNNSLTTNATLAVRQMLKCLNDPTVTDSRHDELKDSCMRLWNLPATIEKNEQIDITEYCKSLVGETPLLTSCKILKRGEISHIFECPREWFFVPIFTTSNCTFFLSQNGSETYMYEVKDSVRTWKLAPDIGLVLPVGTLVYGELVTEYTNAGDKTTALHIIDGLVLGGTDIRHLILKDRHAMCMKFSESINCITTFVKNGEGKYIRKAERRCKELELLNDVNAFVQLHRKCWRELPGQSGKRVVHNKMRWTGGPRRVYVLNAVMFMRNGGDISVEGLPSQIHWLWTPNTFNILNGEQSANDRFRNRFQRPEPDSVTLNNILAIL